MRTIEEVWQHMLDIVEHVGYGVQGVGGSETTPSYAYTIGLSAKGLPELVMIGVGFEAANSILNAACRKLLAGEQFTDGALHKELANLPLTSKDVEAEDGAQIAIGARRFARDNGHALRVVQMVIPDAAGLFPWQEGCAPHIRAMQDLKALIRQNEIDAAAADEVDETPRTPRNLH